MSRSTISTYQVFKLFPDQDTARTFMEQKRWPDGVQCPHCQENERIGVHTKGYHKCLACKEVFTVRTKTVMERSHIPLHKWIYGMYLLVTARKGISSVQLAKEIGISQPSAWFMLQRLREACRNPTICLAASSRLTKPILEGAKRTSTMTKSSRVGAALLVKRPCLVCASAKAA